MPWGFYTKHPWESLFSFYCFVFGQGKKTKNSPLSSLWHALATSRAGSYETGFLRRGVYSDHIAIRAIYILPPHEVERYLMTYQNILTQDHILFTRLLTLNCDCLGTCVCSCGNHVPFACASRELILRIGLTCKAPRRRQGYTAQAKPRMKNPSSP